MKNWKNTAIALIILVFGAVWARADSVPEFLLNGYEALFYHSLRLEESFPTINPIGLSIAEFERAAKDGQTAGEANLMLGLIYKYLNRPGTALGYLLQFSAAHPDQVWINSMIGDLYEEMGRIDDARTYYELALAHSEPDQAFAQAYYGLGSVAYQRQEYEEAKEAFSTALKDSGDYFDARFALGKTLFQLGEYEKAIDTLEPALLQAPRHAPLHYLLAVTYEAAGQAEKAEHAFKRVAELE